jgi:hypothetical protein
MDAKKGKACEHSGCLGHKHVGDECVHRDGTRHKIHGCRDCK